MLRIRAVLSGLTFSIVALSGNAGAATIAIDVGHFLEQPGAISARGRAEFEFNRALALEVEKAVAAQGFKTRLIGADGNMANLTARTHAAAGTDFFLSLHHDSVQQQFIETWTVDGTEQHFSDRASGSSFFISRRNPKLHESSACASAIGAEFRAAGFRLTRHHAEAIPGEHKPWADEQNGVHYYDNLIVLKTARIPAVLLEAGVIVNRDDELVLLKPETRTRMAEAIAIALKRCIP